VRAALLALLVALPGVGKAAALETAYLSLLAADYLQTRWIADNSYELNPILGRHPSQAKVRNYFLGVAAGSLAVLEVLPSDKRRVALICMVGLEGATVARNLRIGVRFKF